MYVYLRISVSGNIRKICDEIGLWFGMLSTVTVISTVYLIFTFKFNLIQNSNKTRNI